MYRAYCYPERDKKFYAPVNLNDAEDVFLFVDFFKGEFHEIKIVDPLDCVVAQALGGKITFPPEWVTIEEGKGGLS